MEFTPYNDTLVCECIVPQFEEVEKNGIAFKKENMPIYKVVATSDTEKYNIDDEVICSNLGAKFEVDNRILYIMKFENVIGKVK